MDRQTVYPGAIPLDTDLLSTQRNIMTALGYMMQAAFGPGPQVDSLVCTPTSPASMVVNVGPGSIIAMGQIDVNSWGSLPADTNPLVKIGINSEGLTPFTLTAPGTSGQSINYLIEASFLETDTTPVVLPYYNAGNPSQPYSGPTNSGVAQDTQRTQRCQLQLKAGTPANTGTQITPGVDVGWVGIWVITVNYGQTTITGTSIAEYPAAPFIPWKIPQLAPGFTREVWFQTPGAWSWTPPQGVVRARIHLQGPGGGGGGCNTANGAGGGGGGGGYGRVVVSVTPGVAISGVVGAAGTGGTGSGNGVAGTNTTCTTFGVTAFVGAGGASFTNGGGLVGGGGVTGSVDYSHSGEGGGAGQVFSSGSIYGGGGGGCPGNGQGGILQLNINSVGLNGSFPGQGATGGSGNNAGGNGGNGYVRIEY